MLARKALVLQLAQPFPFPGALLPTAFPGAILNNILASDVPTYIGRLSYAIYMWHMPIIALIRLTLLGHDAHVDIAIALSPLAVLLLSVASYHLVEVPLRSAEAASWLTLLSHAFACFRMLLGLLATCATGARVYAIMGVRASGRHPRLWGGLMGLGLAVLVLCLCLNRAVPRGRTNHLLLRFLFVSMSVVPFAAGFVVGATGGAASLAGFLAHKTNANVTNVANVTNAWRSTHRSPESDGHLDLALTLTEHKGFVLSNLSLIGTGY